MNLTTYDSFLYRDGLLAPKYIKNTQSGTPVTITDIIDSNVYGDNFLYSYICSLDEEIFSEPPVGLPPIAEAVWESDDWMGLMIKVLDESRKHGWCVVQFYDETANKRWRVFTNVEFTDYIKELDSNGKHVLVGMKFEWTDYLGNTFKDELMFEDPYTHLIKFKEGNGQTFAFPDLTDAIMGLAFQIRQIKGQLSFSGAKPSYQHFVYGKGANDNNIADLKSKIRGISTTAAIGAQEDILKEIRTIKNENVDMIEPALDKLLAFFSGLTRLPLSFYMGKSQSGGLSDVGSKMEKLQVLNKKKSIFKLYVDDIREMFNNVYGITLNDLEIPQEIALDEVEEETNKLTPFNGVNANGQEDKGIHQSK